MTEEELKFVAWLSRINRDLGRYVVRLMDEADPLCTTEYTTDLVEVEAELARALRQAARVVAARSTTLPRQGLDSVERAAHAGQSNLVIDQPPGLHEWSMAR